ncbi:MAG: protein kinase [Candidatus Eremiobacterota bacterium]
MIFCDKCGHQNREDAKFCQGCGGKIIPVTESGSLGKGIILDGRYEIKRKIKSGGMGSVYEAVDRRFLDKPCAVKEMITQSTNPADQQYMIKAFRKEAEILHDLRHPNLPIVKDYFIEHGRYYLVMDYIDGKDLETVIQGYFPVGVPEDKVLEWSKQILEALDYLHSQSPPVVYRDLKPANIMIKNGDGKIMLIDFGIARRVLPDSQTTKTSVGTPVFAAEELFYGKPVPASDIYSLGATMHCLLAGEMPVVPFSFKPLRAINPDVSRELEDIVMKALSMAPKDRYKSAKEMKKVIEAYEEEKHGKVHTVTDEDNLLKEDIEKYEVEIKENSHEPAGPLITAIPPSRKNKGKGNTIIPVIISLVLLTGILVLWKFYFNNQERYVSMAEKHLSSQNFSIAADLCNKALLLNPDNKEAHKILLQAYMAQKKIEEAGRELDKIITHKGGTSENYLTWGESFYNSGGYSYAVRCFECLLEEKPGDPELIAKIARSYEQIPENKKAAEQYIKLGEIYFKNKDLKKAEDTFHSVLKLDETSIQAKKGLVRCYLKNEDYLNAVKLLKTLPDSEKKGEEVKALFLECYLKTALAYTDKNIDGALEAYNNALKLDKNNMPAKEGLARCYITKIKFFIKKNDLKNAKDTCGIVEKLFPEGNFEQEIKKFRHEIDELEKKSHKPAPTPYSPPPVPYIPPPANPPPANPPPENLPPDVIGL